MQISRASSNISRAARQFINNFTTHAPNDSWRVYYLSAHRVLSNTSWQKKIKGEKNLTNQNMNKNGYTSWANQNVNKKCYTGLFVLDQSEILSGATWGNPRARSGQFPKTPPFDINKTSSNPHIQLKSWKSAKSAKLGWKTSTTSWILVRFQICFDGIQALNTLQNESHTSVLNRLLLPESLAS